MKYNTKQKQIVLKLLEEHSTEHLTIERMKELLEKQNEVISIATIYRKVDELVEEGKVQRIVFDNTQKACFQIKNDDHCHEHFHLVCEDCGKLIHLDCHEVDKIAHHIEEDHNFKVNSTKIVFYGKCEDCLRKSK